MTNNSTELTAAKLKELTEWLDPKQMRYVIADVLRGESIAMRREAVQEMIRTVKSRLPISKMKQQVRNRVDRSRLEAIVSVSNRGDRNMIAVRRKNGTVLKPMTAWANSGVYDRKTRSGLNRGTIEGLGFVETGAAKAIEQSPERMTQNFNKKLTRKAEKIGLL